MKNENLLPVFKTERLVLRSVCQNDINNYHKHFVDYDVIQHLAIHVPWPYPDDGVKLFLENNIFPNQGKNLWMWGIFEKNNPDELIGAVHLWREAKPDNRGFWLGKKFWDKGYMTEAVSPIMDYAFEHLGFEKLIFANAIGNKRSGRVKEKTGAKLIDVKPAQFVNPKYTEHAIWELKKEDWKNRIAEQTEFNDGFVLSTDKNRLNIDTICSFLSRSQWAAHRKRDTIKKSITHSLCYGVYEGQNQIAFTRVVTDYSTYAYLCDVFVDEKYRGKGLSKWIMACVMKNPDLQALRRFTLATKDTHSLYEKFGFRALSAEENKRFISVLKDGI